MSKPTGAYRWRYEPDWIDGLDNGSWVAEWDDDATPTCDTCADRGEWVGEHGVETCPSCGGRSAKDAIAAARRAR